MPSLVLFGRRTLVAGDDLCIYAGISSLMRLAQFVMGIALIFISYEIYQDNRSVDTDCITEEEEFILVITNYSYLSLAVILAGVGLVMEQAVWLVSRRGTPTQPEKRAQLRPICHFDLTLMMLFRAIMATFGGFALATLQTICECIGNESLCPDAAFTLYWALIITHGIEIGFNVLVILYLGCKCLPALPFALGNSESRWRIFCRCCCTVSSILTCCVVGGSEAIIGDFTDIAILLADFFNYRGTLDLVPSDIVTGMVMVNRMQREQVEDCRQAVLERAEELQARTQSFDNIESSDRQGLDDVAKMWNNRHSNADIAYRLKRREGSSGAFWEPRVTKLLTAEDQDDVVSMAEGVRFMQLALAIYSWLMYVYNRPYTGLCELSCQSATQVYKRGKRYVGDTAFCRFHAAAFLRRSGLEETEIAHASFRTGVVHTPYAVVLDHDWKSIVIVIRGTLSLEDALADLTVRPVSMKEAGEMYGFDGAERYAHAGMLQSALWILKDIEENNVLTDLFSQDGKFSTYRLRVTGHSLGGGCAAILSILLRPKYPDLLGHCFSPPGCTLSLNAMQESQEYLTSYVLNSDIVIRLCLDSLENLRFDIVEIISRIKVPKNDIIGCYKRKKDRSEDIREANKLLLHAEDEIPDSDFKLSWKKYEELYMNVKQDRDFPDVSLYPPGRIIQLFKTSADEPKSCFSFGQTPPDFVSRWAGWEDFREIRISSTFLDDHDPLNVLDHMKAEAARLGLKFPYVVDTTNDDVEQPLAQSIRGDDAEDDVEVSETQYSGVAHIPIGE